MLSTLAVATAAVLGTMTGVEASVVVFTNPALRRLPIGPSITARADGARVGGRVMPFWYFASLLLTAGLTAAAWDRSGSSGAAALAACALLVVSVVMSVALLVPINNRTAGWTADSHPADWREQQQRWDRLHWARVAVVAAAFVLVLVAVVGA